MGPARRSEGFVAPVVHLCLSSAQHPVSFLWRWYPPSWGSPQTLTKEPSAKTLAQSPSRHRVCFSTVPCSIGLNSGTFRENSLWAAGLRQEGCQFRVASSHRPGAASSQGEAGGERNTSWHPALLESVSPVAALPVDRMVESETFPVRSRHAGCSATGDPTRGFDFLPSLGLSPQLYSSARQEAISKWRTRTKCGSPSTRLWVLSPAHCGGRMRLFREFSNALWTPLCLCPS